MSKPHQEEQFETEIVEALRERGWRQGDPSEYDRTKALLPGEVVEFVRATQPKKWDHWQNIHGDGLEDRLAREVAKKASKRGSLEIIRHGFRFSGRQVRLAFFEPAHGLNPDLREKYEQNRLTVVRQLPFDPNTNETVDLCLFLNGIPVMTAELKMPTAGQTWENAIAQYQARNPKAPLFRFKERALVHFAVDSEQAHMTTELAGEETHFLPFNKGRANDHAGNPPVEGKHRTHYLWEEIWAPETFLELVGRYLHVQVEMERDAKGRPVEDETVIFPRYHQYECVEQLLEATLENGPGENYLVQHSTGSGKSISIAWLAHRLQNLHDADDQKVFDSVVVVTDRRVLDDQIKDTIYQIDHQEGVVRPTDHSSELAERLEEGAPIIISTLQTFPYVVEKVSELPERNYAVIVDEGHRSQSGSMAAELKELLSNESDFVDDLEEFREQRGGAPADGGSGTEEALTGAMQDEVQLAAYKSALARGPRPNLSFYAFTATPKYKTLEMFGDTDERGKPAPFHTYSMQQAIEEGFIVDVLQNYVTYETYYQLVKRAERDVEVDKSEASRELKRFVKQHPHNVEQKSRIIVEHFQQHTRHKIDGRAKAMVVTDSRAQAVQFKLAIDDVIDELGFDIGTLVAFSDEVDHPHTGVSYTEEQMNDGIKQSELPDKFHTDEFRILVVANKYQTGFDEPLLHTMYVDRRLSGIRAVQTLSRLNRQHPDKDDTLVLDFENDREEILASFDDFYTTTTADEQVDPQKLYDVKHRLDEFRIIHREDVDAVADVVFGRDPGHADNATINGRIEAARDRFQAATEEERSDFRSLLGSFLRLYSFMAQIIEFGDAELEKFYVFGRLLRRALPSRHQEETMDLDVDEVAGLEYYTTQKAGEGRLTPGSDRGTVDPPSNVGTGQPTQQEMVELSQIIEVINDQFGTDFDPDHSVANQVAEKMISDPDVQQAARVNDEDHFKDKTRGQAESEFYERHEENHDLVTRIAEDEEFGEALLDYVLEHVYRRANEGEEVAGG
jgi:type I restriction enzyme R subunit